MFLPARSHALALILLAVSASADLEQDLAAGNFPAAERELEEIAIEWSETDPTNPDHARVLIALGAVERKLGKTEEAVVHLRKALDLPAEGTPELRQEAREALALALQDLGSLEKSEALLRANLEYGDLRTLDHLGIVLLQLGRYHDSREMLRKALLLTPSNEPDALARRHGLVARVDHTLGSHARALSHLDQGLGLAPADPGLRLSLESAKALAHLRLHETEAARTGFERCADVARALFEDRPLDAVPHLVNLGTLALATGEAEAAQERFAEAAGMLENTGYGEHPAIIPILNDLGIAEQKRQNYGESRRYLERAATLQARHFPEAHLRSAEILRNLAATALLAGDSDAASLAQRADRLGLATLDELILHGSETERLNFLQRIDLVSLSCMLGDAEAIAEVLLKSKSRLLDGLIDPMAAPSEGAPLRLEPDEALIDFCRFTPPGEEPRYGAVLRVDESAPQWIPLASETELSGWMKALHRRIEWKTTALSGDPSPPPPFHLHGILRELDRLCFDPVRVRLPRDCRRLAIAPDGILHAVPFAALLGPDGSFVCESIPLAVRIDSARDLSVSRSEPHPGDGPWWIAGVQGFASPSGKPGTPLEELLADLSPLPGTLREIQMLQELAPPRSRVLHSASERDLSEIKISPRVLHFATHSFFIGDTTGMPGPLDFDRSPDLLFASGIALTGAPAHLGESLVPGALDDVLFPQEIAQLPLRDTRLVVLSTCRSGAGTPVQGGESLGLRRAFAMAGALEVASALWPVSDASSPEWMARFHRLSLDCGQPAQALWQLQRETLRQGDDPEAAILRAAPYFIVRHAPLPAITDFREGSALPWKWLLALIPATLFLIGKALRARP